MPPAPSSPLTPRDRGSLIGAPLAASPGEWIASEAESALRRSKLVPASMRERLLPPGWFEIRPNRGGVAPNLSIVLV